MSETDIRIGAASATLEEIQAMRISQRAALQMLTILKREGGSVLTDDERALLNGVLLGMGQTLVFLASLEREQQQWGRDLTGKRR